MDAVFPVCERFISVNGEGLASGQRAAFIRFAGCNLCCAYCDTAWANEATVDAEALTEGELVSWVRASGVSAVTLTGGEPLLQPGLPALIGALLAVEEPCALRVEVETNGSCDLTGLAALREEARVHGRAGSLVLTVDWKTPSAGVDASAAMDPAAFGCLDGRDAVKFVVGTPEDVAFAAARIAEEGLEERTNVLLSPLWGQMDPARLVNLMEREGLRRTRLQLQLHKIIWPAAARGV